MGHLILVDCCLTGSLVLRGHRPPALPVTCTVTMKMAQWESSKLTILPWAQNSLEFMEAFLFDYAERCSALAEYAEKHVKPILPN